MRRAVVPPLTDRVSLAGFSRGPFNTTRGYAENLPRVFAPEGPTHTVRRGPSTPHTAPLGHLRRVPSTLRRQKHGRNFFPTGRVGARPRRRGALPSPVIRPLH
jgi:hypothetical protein